MRSFRRLASGVSHAAAARCPDFSLAMVSPSKKSLRAAERKRADVARARRRWIREQGFLDPTHLAFIDETAVTTDMMRLNGWNPRGERLVSDAPMGHWETVTSIAGLRLRTFVNRRWTEYTGLSAEDTVGSGWKTAIHPEDFERWLKLWRACLATGQPFEDEVRFRRVADGEYRWFWTRGVPLRDKQGNIAGWYGLGMDIQDRKYAEQERERLLQLERQAERELRVTIDTIPALVARYRPDGSPDFVNQTWQTYIGVSQDSLRGQRWAVAIQPDDLPRIAAAWPSHLAPGQPFQMEQLLCRADGEYRWFLVRRVPLRNENGEVISWYGVGHDLEDQKRAEHALQTAHAELTHVTRVTTLGEMSASIAHEVNQPLTAIATNAEASLRWLSRDVPDIEEARASIGQV